MQYILVGGLVHSQYDHQLHHVNAKKLCELYGLNPEDCLFTEERKEGEITRLKLRHPKAIVLRPRFDGQYIV